MSVVKQLLACLLLLALAAGGWYAYQHPQTVGLAADEGQSPNAGGNGQRSGARQGNGGSTIPGLSGRGGAVNVITAEVATDQGGDRVVALGTVMAARSVVVMPQVAGLVAEVLFTPGEAVEEGAVLVRLEDAEEQVALDRARIELQQAHGALERSQKLAESKTITAVALAEAETAARLAEVEVRSAEIALKRRTMTAPFAGVTGLTDVSPGDLVTASTEITTLDDIEKMRVGFEVPERWASRIAVDHPLVATAQALPGSSIPGRIVAVDNRVDETTRTLRLEAELRNEERLMRAGMAINVTLEFETDQQLAVPTLAVQWDREGSYVWKVAEGAAHRAPITILERESGVVIVQGELAPGDSVVVEGIQRLRQGSTIVDVGEGGGAPDNPAVSAGEPAAARS